MTDVDPSKVLREARDLAKYGKYAEALEKYQWLYENLLAYDPTWCGVRNSVALSYWVELGESYPPARLALESVRDTKAKALREGSLERQLFSDVSAINKELDQIGQTSDLFKEISERDQEFAQKCFPLARIALVHTRDYALARRFIRSPRETLARLAGRLNESIADGPSTATTASILLKNADVENYIEDVKHLVEILVGAGEVDEAGCLRNAAIQLIADSAVRDQIVEQLK
jgi:hypothetical protein